MYVGLHGQNYTSMYQGSSVRDSVKSLGCKLSRFLTNPKNAVREP